MSASSPAQSALIDALPVDKPVFVEGAFIEWLRDKPVTYFILKSDTTETYKQSLELEEKHQEEGNNM